MRGQCLFTCCYIVTEACEWRMVVPQTKTPLTSGQHTQASPFNEHIHPAYADVVGDPLPSGLVSN